MTRRTRLGRFVIGVLAVFGWIDKTNAAGAWIAESQLPAIHSRAIAYRSPWLTPRPTTPLAGEAITRVSWRYGYDRPEPIRAC